MLFLPLVSNHQNYGTSAEWTIFRPVKRRLYSPSCRKEVFSETGLPVLPIAANWWHEKVPQSPSPALHSVALCSSCWVVGSPSLLPPASLQPPPPSSTAGWSCICSPLP